MSKKPQDKWDRIAERRICITEMYGARFPTQQRRSACVSKEAAALRRVARVRDKEQYKLGYDDGFDKGFSRGYEARIFDAIEGQE